MRYITKQYGLSDYALDPENESYVTCKSDRIITREREDGRIDWHEVGRDDEYDYVSVLDQMDAEQRYATSDVYDQPTPAVYVEGELMNVYALDATYALGDKAINRYQSKDGFIKVGSVEVRYFADGTPVAKCVRCNARLTYAVVDGMDDADVTSDADVMGDADTNERFAMEEFTLAVIRHGNNHAAKGYRFTDNNGVEQYVPRTITPIGVPVAWSIRKAEADNYNRAIG